MHSATRWANHSRVASDCPPGLGIETPQKAVLEPVKLSEAGCQRYTFARGTESMPIILMRQLNFLLP